MTFEKSSITVSTSTRRRLKYIAEQENVQESYDEFLNKLLDKNGYPTWETIKAEYIKHRPKDAPAGSCHICGGGTLERRLYTDNVFCMKCGTMQPTKQDATDEKVAA